VGKGTAVGILYPQGPDFVAALFAVTRIGALAVPLSTFLRGPELRRTVRHTDVHTLMAPSVLLGRDIAGEVQESWPDLDLSSGGPLFTAGAPFLRRVLLTTGDDSAAGDIDDVVSDDLVREVEAEVTPADRMVLVSTSGATADPKGVIHTHGAQVRQAWKLAQLYGLTSTDRTFTTMPFFWTGGLTVSLLPHLHVGATVITVERTDSGEMLDLIEATRPTRLSGWTLMERLTADPTFAARDMRWLAQVKVAPHSAPEMRHNSLGMTETSGPHTVAAAADNDRDLPEHLRGSFGPPIEGMQHKVVDPSTGAPVADGEEGEICVRGDHLMEGLHKKERRDTFDEDGWYHTGDRGYFREGYLFYTGRLTEMIKTGGANVAPREVELAVESLPGVKAAFVVGLPDPARGEVVGCVVCPEPGHDLDLPALTKALSERLSSYKMPRRLAVFSYEDLPWLASGKISKPGIVELLQQA
jgi:acyl-CoA synthetase (AMP-forming)/AMP-acid ligase II